MSTERILVRAAKSPFRAASARETLAENLIGTNSGNLLFSTAAVRLLSTRNAEVLPERFNVTPDQADEINERYDRFVVPLANAFRPEFLEHLERLSATVEKLKIPVTIMGVGAQAPGEGDRAALKPLDAAVTRLCRAVLERSESIGVRGEFTAPYLNDLGFTRVEVIGCPSIFLRDGAPKVPHGASRLSADARLAINLTPHIPGIRELAAHHARAYRRSVYVAQELRDLRLMLRTNFRGRRDDLAEAPQVPGDAYMTPSRGRFYLDPRTWVNDLQATDFSFGTRIHGNIAAIVAGRPAFVLAHDSRTLELARALDIPHLQVTNVATIRAEELYEQADFQPLNKNHAQRLARMTSFLERNGLKHIHQPGESGAAFDARMDATKLPPAVRPVSTISALAGVVRRRIARGV
jgi:hypothetical protein